MDRGKLLLACLPLFFFCFDICDLLSTPPPKSSDPIVYHPPHRANLNQTHSANLNQTLEANLNQTLAANLNQTHSASLNQTGTTNDTVLIKFSSICSYRGTSMSIKLLVLQEFPGVGIIMIVMAGGYIFPELGTPTPSWYHRLSADKFSVIAIPWLLGSIVINYLQNTEAFEVYFNDELVFCKLQAGRFPTATEMREIFRSRLTG